MTKIEELIDDNIWNGGWYQNITLPSGDKTISTTLKFDNSESRGGKKWDMIEPYMIKGKTFLDIGCNAGLYLVKANELYKKLYGVDVSEHFLKQCKYVLDEFKVKAELICSNALEIDFKALPTIDTTIMVNALYWVAYSDEEGYIDDYEAKMKKFINELSKNTKELVLVGAETIERIGGTIEMTRPFIDKDFEIIESKIVQLNDRKLNVIYARSKDKRFNKKA